MLVWRGFFVVPRSIDRVLLPVAVLAGAGAHPIPVSTSGCIRS